MRPITSEGPGRRRCVKKWSFHCQTLRLSDSLVSGTYTSSSVDQSSWSCRQPHAPVVTCTTSWQSSLIPVYLFVFHNTDTFPPPLLVFALSVIINQKSLSHSSIHTPDITVNLSSCQTVSFDLKQPITSRYWPRWRNLVVHSSISVCDLVPYPHPLTSEQIFHQQLYFLIVYFIPHLSCSHDTWSKACQENPKSVTLTGPSSSLLSPSLSYSTKNVSGDKNKILPEWTRGLDSADLSHNSRSSK